MEGIVRGVTRCGIAALVAGVVVACTTLDMEAAPMYEQAAALTKVASALDALLYEAGEVTVADQVLLARATAHDPSLLTPFQGYSLRADAHAGHGVVLVCDAQGREGLLLDMGCTAAVDDHLWRTFDREPCAIDLAAVAGCPR